MIKFEHTDVVGWEHAIRGMRNPFDSWGNSDSCYEDDEFLIKKNDFTLMKKLVNAGVSHSKFRRMITVYVDITAPLYWWKQFDTYKVGTVANSCSTMHTVSKKVFELDDFSQEQLMPDSLQHLKNNIDILNKYREFYLNMDETNRMTDRKKIWWQLIQLLPSSYNQKRTVMFNYEVLSNIYSQRQKHKVDEWDGFCKWIEELPYSHTLIIDKKH